MRESAIYGVTSLSRMSTPRSQKGSPCCGDTRPVPIAHDRPVAIALGRGLNSWNHALARASSPAISSAVIQWCFRNIYQHAQHRGPSSSCAQARPLPQNPLPILFPLPRRLTRIHIHTIISAPRLVLSSFLPHPNTTLPSLPTNKTTAIQGVQHSRRGALPECQSVSFLHKKAVFHGSFGCLPAHTQPPAWRRSYPQLQEPANPCVCSCVCQCPA